MKFHDCSAAGQLLGLRGDADPDQAQVMVEHEGVAVRDDRVRAPDGLQLAAQEIRRPDVVVVEEGHPRRARLGDRPVARRRDARARSRCAGP